MLGAGCEAVAVDEGTVELTVRVSLLGGQAVGPTPAAIFVFTDSVPIIRASALPWNAEPCALADTPQVTCTFTVPRGRPVSLIAHESDPAVMVRLAPMSAQDTVRDGRFVEFTRWTGCDDRPERGVCVVRPRGDATVDASFQLMQQVTVYQTGAARMDYVTFAAAFTLKVPAQAHNILDLVGCRRVFSGGAPCDSVRLMGPQVFHRFTAYVPRQTIVGFFPDGGAQTEFGRWDGFCIPSVSHHPGVCSLVSPDSAGAPIILTAHYQWWDCPDGPSDRNWGFCTLRDPPQPALAAGVQVAR